MAMNAVRAYFSRNDMMSSAPISQNLKRCHVGPALGSHLYLIWEAAGLFVVLCSEASVLCLSFTPPPWMVRSRFFLLMVVAFCFGAFVGPFTKYLFEIDQRRRGHWNG